MKNYWHVYYRSYGGLFNMSVEAPTEMSARVEFHRIKGEATKDFYIEEVKNHMPSYAAISRMCQRNIMLQERAKYCC